MLIIIYALLYSIPILAFVLSCMQLPVFKMNCKDELSKFKDRTAPITILTFITTTLIFMAIYTQLIYEPPFKRPIANPLLDILLGSAVVFIAITMVEIAIFIKKIGFTNMVIKIYSGGVFGVWVSPVIVYGLQFIKNITNDNILLLLANILERISFPFEFILNNMLLAFVIFIVTTIVVNINIQILIIK